MKGLGKILPVLAPLFNSLLNIPENYFGSTPRRHEPSPANKRAARDLAAHRAKFAYVDDLPKKITRQQRRRTELLAAKHERRAAAKAAVKARRNA